MVGSHSSINNNTNDMPEEFDDNNAEFEGPVTPVHAQEGEVDLNADTMA